MYSTCTCTCVFCPGICSCLIYLFFNVFQTFTPEELEGALRPVFNKVWDHGPESYAFHQAVDPEALRIPVCYYTHVHVHVHVYSGTPYNGHLWIKDTSLQGTLFLSHFDILLC